MQEACFSSLLPKGACCCRALPFSWRGVVGKDQAPVSQSWERFAPPAQGQRCLLPPAREMFGVSRSLCYWIARYLVKLLSRKEPRWEVPAMAFLVEVSLMASAASLSCLPPLCPLVATAARGAQSVELGQRVGSSACPWPLAAGVTLVPPTCVSCPPCACSRSSIVAPRRPRNRRLLRAGKHSGAGERPALCAPWHRAGSPGALCSRCRLWARLPGTMPVACAAGWTQPCAVLGSCWPGTPVTALCVSAPGLP